MIEAWSEEERVAAVAVFKKIASNNQAWLAALRRGETPEAYPLPHDLYEAHRLTLKSISSEIGVFDEGGRILLVLRPSSSEDPAEPYPSLWHIPGTRHIVGETNDEALERLLKTEIGAPVETRFVECKEYQVNEARSSFLFSLLYLARASSSMITMSEKRQWFDPQALPDSLLKAQKPIIDRLVECL